MRAQARMTQHAVIRPCKYANATRQHTGAERAEPYHKRLRHLDLEAREVGVEVLALGHSDARGRVTVPREEREKIIGTAVASLTPSPPSCQHKPLGIHLGPWSYTLMLSQRFVVFTGMSAAAVLLVLNTLVAKHRDQTRETQG